MPTTSAAPLPPRPCRCMDQAVPLVSPTVTLGAMTAEAAPSGAAVPSRLSSQVQGAPDAPPRTPVFVEDHVCKVNGIKVLLVDVSTKSGRAQLKGLLENPDVRWVHWAPSCWDL